MEAKRKLIREAKRFQGVWCRACRHKCMDQQATHCPTCGVRFTSKGVIAVGDIGSENFQEQTRESRASLADRLAERASLESRPGTAGLIEAPAESAAAAVGHVLAGDGRVDEPAEAVVRSSRLRARRWSTSSRYASLRADNASSKRVNRAVCLRARAARRPVFRGRGARAREPSKSPSQSTRRSGARHRARAARSGRRPRASSRPREDRRYAWRRGAGEDLRREERGGGERWRRWNTWHVEQQYHGVVRCALGWACWRTRRATGSVDDTAWERFTRCRPPRGRVVRERGRASYEAAHWRSRKQHSRRAAQSCDHV